MRRYLKNGHLKCHTSRNFSELRITDELEKHPMTFWTHFRIRSQYFLSLSSRRCSNDDPKAQLNRLLQEFIEKNSTKDDSTVNPKKVLSVAVEKKNLKPPKEPQIQDKVKEVSNIYGNHAKQIEIELIKKLQETSSQNNDLKNIIHGMEVDTEKKPTSSQISMSFRRPTRPRSRTPKRDLFTGETLGIFSKDYLNSTETQETPIACSEHWQKLEKHELNLMVTHPPENYFQQVIKWTEEGKLWKFPIDNEQDMAERNVPFTEHIFLEAHLEPWCPKKGPIRHYMELVCNGLSKNPFFSVEEKKGHILWYRDFFESKKSLLKEVGALD